MQEVWIVRSSEETVEVIRLSLDEIKKIGIYERGHIVTSKTFAGLTVAVDDIFAA